MPDLPRYPRHAPLRSPAASFAGRRHLSLHPIAAVPARTLVSNGFHPFYVAYLAAGLRQREWDVEIVTSAYPVGTAASILRNLPRRWPIGSAGSRTGRPGSSRTGCTRTSPRNSFRGRSRPGFEGGCEAGGRRSRRRGFDSQASGPRAQSGERAILLPTTSGLALVSSPWMRPAIAESPRSATTRLCIRRPPEP